MALTPSFVKRTVDPTGDDIKTFDDGAGNQIQAFVAVDADGDPTGIQSNPEIIRWPVTGPAFSGAGFVTDLILAPFPVTLYEFRAVLDPTVFVDHYVMLFDDPVPGAPPNGTVPLWRGLLPAAGEMSDDWRAGLQFFAALKAAVSTTGDTFTAGVAGAVFSASFTTP